MNLTETWKECFVDPERGLAVFDGLTIHADSMLNPRQDRVFPIFNKEQVFMCRQMAPVLNLRQKQSGGSARQEPGLPVALDVGTGSGVLAIFAAKHGCKVHAIDISARAIEFARHNAEINQVRVFKDQEAFETSREPGIWLRQERFDEEFAPRLLRDTKNEEGCFDFIMLNPPYNPTIEYVKAALHADGGEDGQREFNQQIRLVPRLLRVGGYCFAHHMGAIKAGEQDPNIVQGIEAAFHAYNEEAIARTQSPLPVQFSVTGKYVKVLENDCDVKKFLEAEYKNYLVEGLGFRKLIRPYIERVAGKWDKFSLLYFEFEKQITPPGADPSVLMGHHNSGVSLRPTREQRSWIGWTWETREWLHRCIVQHATSATAVPWPSLFTDFVFSDPALLKRDNVPSAGDSPSLPDSSPMQLLNQWLDMLPPRRRPLFDLIYIESVPYTPDAVAMPNLKQEAAVWLSNKFAGESGAKLDVLAQRCLGEWAACVQILNDRKIAPFLHPVYVGTRNPTDAPVWNPLMQSFLRNSCSAHAPGGNKEARLSAGQDGNTPTDFPAIRLANEKGRYPDLDLQYAAFDEYFGAVRRETLLAVAEAERPEDSIDPNDTEHRQMNSLDYRSWRDTNNLKELGVGQIDEYRAHCTERLQEIYKNIAQASGKSETDVIKTALANPDSRRMDLEYCHGTLHGLVANAFGMALQRPPKWSQLLSVPLDLSDPLNADISGVLPSTFRGSVFIFVGSFEDEWSPRQDRLLFDLARFTALLYNGRFNVEEAKRVHHAGERSGEKGQLVSFAHQTSAVIDSIVQSTERLPDGVRHGMGPSLIGRLHVLREFIASYRSSWSRVDPGLFPYPWGKESPLAAYRDIGIELGLARAQNGPNDEPLVRSTGRVALEPENQLGQAGFEGYREWFAVLPVIDLDTAEYLKHSNFAVLIILVLKQAVYHKIRALAQAADSAPISINIIAPGQGDIFACRIDNPRVAQNDELKVSKDAKELQELAHRLSAIPDLRAHYFVAGPKFDPALGLWSTTVRIRRTH